MLCIDYSASRYIISTAKGHSAYNTQLLNLKLEGSFIMTATSPLLYPSSIPSSFTKIRPTAEKRLTTELDIDHFEKSTGLSRTTLFLAAWCFTLSMHASEPVDSVVFGWADQGGRATPFKIDSLGSSASVLSFLFAVEESAKRFELVLKGAALSFVGSLSQLFKTNLTIQKMHFKL